MNVIEMKSVTKSYGATKVLRSLDLNVTAGEVFALLGPNGAGKTTAVEILEGYRRADSGQVTVLGFDPTDAGADMRSQIGIVLQQTTAFEKSTVRETIEMFAALFPHSMPVDTAIAMVELGSKQHEMVEHLSGGQRRRLDVACGIVGRPRLLFLDEPSTGLDPEARRGMWTVIRRLRDEGTTVLLTTHYLDEAEALADRIGILLGGQLAEVASPTQIGRRNQTLSRVQFVPSPLQEVDFRAWDRTGASVWIETNEPARLVADLVQRHGELAELTISRPSLEDTYLDMVAHSEVAQ